MPICYYCVPTNIISIIMNNFLRYYLLHVLFFFYMSYYTFPLSGQNTGTSISKVDVGLILDSNSFVGQVINTSTTIALEDFYENHKNYTTRIILHHRDSKGDVVEAASAAIELLKDVQVKAILGPQRSTQARFVINIGNKARVPIISSATSPHSTMDNPYFIRVAQNGWSQVKALTDILKSFAWHQVVLIFEDNYDGGAMVSHVTNALLKVNVLVKHQSVISDAATEDHILQELHKFKTMQTRVFVVNMLPALASRFFLKAKEIGMMSKGYAWIITDVLASLLDSLHPKVISSMQGVLGVRPYIPKSNGVDKFNEKWRKRFRQEYPNIDRFELNVFGLQAYDSVHALAMAVERVGVAKNQFRKSINSNNLTDLGANGSSEMGPRLLRSIRNIRLKGLTGDFHLIEGQLQSTDYEIVNVIGKGEREIGFWTQIYGISKNLRMSNKNTNNREDLGAIIWPGESKEVPRGWDLPTNEKKLRVGFPTKKSFNGFIQVDKDPKTNDVKPNGFCIDVFEEVLNTLPYAIPYDFIAFEEQGGQPAGYYNDLVYQIFLGKFDAVVGDVTILADRSKYVDFSLPFTESGASMIVPIQVDERKNAWIFMKPLTKDLWVTTGVSIIFTGFVVWVLEHRINKEFRGPPQKQAGMIFWFSFSTMVFSHKERLISNLSRFVMIVWMFLVLVLTSSYTANLASMLTVQKLQPTLTDIKDLIKNGEYVGYQDGSYIDQLLINMGIDKSKLKNYSSVDEFDEALSKGSKNGGVAAVFDELPYLKLLLTKNCAKYTKVGPTFKTAGFGFAFPKGSPLVPDISRAILNVTEAKMTNIEKKWFGDEAAKCAEQTGNKITSESLDLDSFRGLFLMAGVASVSSLIIYFSIFLYDNRQIICSSEPIKQKLIAIGKNFDQQKEETTNEESKKMTASGDQNGVPGSTAPALGFDFLHSSAVSISTYTEGILSQDEGFSAFEPGTPSNERETVEKAE